jgi:hypothetical protein
MYQSFIDTSKQQISIKIQSDDVFVSNIIEECLNDVDFNFDELKNSRREIFRDNIVDCNVYPIIRDERIEIFIIIDKNRNDFFQKKRLTASNRFKYRWRNDDARTRWIRDFKYCLDVTCQQLLSCQVIFYSIQCMLSELRRKSIMRKRRFKCHEFNVSNSIENNVILFIEIVLSSEIQHHHE